MTKMALWNLLVMRGYASVTINGVTGYFHSIEREDGSGRCFNITLNTDRGLTTVFLRTID